MPSGTLGEFRFNPTIIQVAELLTPRLREAQLHPEWDGTGFDDVQKLVDLLHDRDLRLEQALAYPKFQVPVYQNGWQNYGGGFQSGRYWKDTFGVVHVEGVIKLGTVGAVPAFPLPAGYRPVSNRSFPSYTAGGVLGALNVLSTGDVQVAAGANGSVTMEFQFSTS